MKDDRIRHLKMSTGEEIICEVLEWDDEDDESVELIVRNMYKIISMEPPGQNTRIFTLRPYMCLQNNSKLFQSVNTQHIVTTAIPATKLIHQYKDVVETENMSDEELEKKINAEIEKIRAVLRDVSDSDEPDNVIPFSFKPKDTMH